MSNKNKQKTVEQPKKVVEKVKEVPLTANEEAIEKFKSLFTKADKKKLGKISVNEFKDLMRVNFEDVDPSIIASISEVTDQHNNISLDAYLNFMKVNFLDTEEEDVIKAFKVFDKDNNGYLTCSEFKHILTTLGDKFTEDEVDEVFREANLRGDGKLNYVEFVDFWKSK